MINEIRQAIKNQDNANEQAILNKLDEIIHYPIPKDTMFVVKNFIEIISILQGQINGLLEVQIKHELEIRSLKNKVV